MIGHDGQSGARGRQGGFSLIELMVVIGILVALLGVSLSLFRGMDSSKLRTAADVMTGMIEQGRSVAITRRRPVMLAVLEPENTADMRLRVSLFEFENLEADAGGSGIPGTQIRRWRSLPEGVILAGGESASPDAAGLPNVADAGPIRVIWKDGKAAGNFRGIVFTPRGGLAMPEGSKSVVIKMGLGTYRSGSLVLKEGGGQRMFRIGRMVARPWRLEG